MKKIKVKPENYCREAGRVHDSFPVIIITGRVVYLARSGYLNANYAKRVCALKLSLILKIISIAAGCSTPVHYFYGL